MRSPAWAVALGFLLLVLVAALLVWRRGERAPARGGEARESAPGEPAPPPLPWATETPAARTPFEQGADALRSALASGGDDAAQEAAALLRGLVRLDPLALASARAALLDPATPSDLRAALAFVLGTLPGNDDALLLALEKFGEDEEFARCALLALGAARTEEGDDEMFDLALRPWGEGGPGGIGIVVHRQVEDPRVRQAIAARLEAGPVPARRAAAVALRASVGEADVRDAFLSDLAREASDDVAAVVGEALATWAADEAPDAARPDVLDALLRRAAEPLFDGYRFRLEDDLSRALLSAADRAVLTGLSRPPHPLGVRTFGMAVLAGSAARSGGDALAETRALLSSFLRDDADEAVRDFAAGSLAKLPFDEATVNALARAASADGSWRVRYAAVDALAAWGAGPLAVAALRAAASDADERVADHARELLPK